MQLPQKQWDMKSAGQFVYGGTRYWCSKMATRAAMKLTGGLSGED
jgi:hypothetical protein